MKILVTGASGFVGYHVARNLAAKGEGEVLCLVRPQSERRFLEKLPVRIVEGDLRDPGSLKRALAGCRALFHVAADYRLWAKDPEELIQSNVRGTENILAAAREAGVQRVVYTSSVSAVGRPEAHAAGGPAPGQGRADWERRFAGDESLDPAPSQLIGPYKRSKYLAELAARKFAGSGLDVVTVNPSTPVGSHDVKPTPTGKMILDFLNRRMPAYLDTGLNLISVEDVAEGHWLAYRKGKAGERYILGNGNFLLKEILQMLGEVTGLPAPRIKIPYWAAYAAGWCSTALAEVSGRPPGVPLDGVKMAAEVMFYDSSKAVRDLGLPQTPIEDSLKKAVGFFRSNGYVR